MKNTYEINTMENWLALIYSQWNSGTNFINVNWKKLFHKDKINLWIDWHFNNWICLVGNESWFNLINLSGNILLKDFTKKHISIPQSIKYIQNKNTLIIENFKTKIQIKTDINLEQYSFWDLKNKSLL